PPPSASPLFPYTTLFRSVFARSSSPHGHAPLDTGAVMRCVLLATLPGLVALTWNFGWGSLINVVLASLVALGLEAAIVAARGRPDRKSTRLNSSHVKISY